MNCSCSCAGIHRAHRVDEQPVEVRAGDPVQYDAIEMAEAGSAELLVALGLEVAVGEPAVGRELVVIRRPGRVGDLEVLLSRQVQPRPPAGHQRERAPLDQRLDGPREVVVQARQRHVRAGVGVVDRVDLAVLDEGLARVELPPEEGVHEPADGDHLSARLRRQERVVDRVAQVHGLVRLELHHHGLRADRQRPGEHVVALDRALQVHEHLAARVVGGVQLGRVADPRHPAPRAAVVRLHEQRVADLLGDRVEVERLVVLGGRVGVPGVVHRVLVRHQDGLRHLETEAQHRAVGRVLLHRLERERAVQQVHAVHERDLLEPLARDVVPVGEPVDDQVVARPVPQRERLDRDPLGVEGVPRSVLSGHGANPPHYLLECPRPVLLRAEQQPDQVPLHAGLPSQPDQRPVISRTWAGDGRAGRATMASHAVRRSPTDRARAGCPCPPAARRTGSCSAAIRWCPPTGPDRRPAAG